jgi:hypothetical protein
METVRFRFLCKIANKADSGGKFSRPLVIWGCVNRSYSEWQVFGSKKIQNIWIFGMTNSTYKWHKTFYFLTWNTKSEPTFKDIAASAFLFIYYSGLDTWRACAYNLHTSHTSHTKRVSKWLPMAPKYPWITCNTKSVQTFKDIAASTLLFMYYSGVDTWRARAYNLHTSIDRQPEIPTEVSWQRPFYAPPSDFLK